MDISNFTPLWGSWEIDALIGQGNYGKVYRVKRSEYGKVYYSAVKHISLPASDNEVNNLFTEGIVNDRSSLQAYYDNLLHRLMNEVDINVSLKGHTNIVSYEDHMVIPRSDAPGFDLFIRMELLTPLPQLLQQRPITENEVRKLGADICAALEVMSRRNILHRDIKPSNIFVSDTGDFKIGDFGVSRSLDSASGGVTMAGTLNYMAPEISKGQSVSFRTDMYSLGLVLYRLCNANRAPFVVLPPAPATADMMEASNQRRFSGQALPPPAYASSDLASIILKACEFDPGRRFSSPAEMRNALQRYYRVIPDPPPSPPGSKPLPAPPTPPAPESDNKGKSKLWIVAAAIVCIAIAMFAAAFSIINDRDEPYGDAAATQQPHETSFDSLDPTYPITVGDDYVLELGLGSSLDYGLVYRKIHIPYVFGDSDGATQINQAIQLDYGGLIEDLKADYASGYPILDIKYDVYKNSNIYSIVILMSAAEFASEPFGGGSCYHYDENTGSYLSNSEYAHVFGLTEDDVMYRFQEAATEFNNTHMTSYIPVEMYVFDDLNFFFNEYGELVFTTLLDPYDIEAYLPGDPMYDPIGHYYEVIIGDYTWDEAEYQCELRGGHLATITSETEFLEIVSLVENIGVKYYWLGGCTALDGDNVTPYWITGEDFVYQPWCVNEPSGIDEAGNIENRILLWNLPEYGGWSFNDVPNDPFFVRSYTGNIAFICEYGDGLN